MDGLVNQNQQGRQHTGVLSTSWLSVSVCGSDTFSGSPLSSSDPDIGA